jgi:hypothetical protein
MATDWPAMERRGPAVDEAAVAGFEKRLGHRLPEDYRQFVLEVNGGRPAISACEFSRGVVNHLFSLDDDDDARDLLTAYERPRPLPSRELLHVGHDDGGARILLALAGEHRGEVWLQNTSDPRPDDANPRVAWHDRRDMRKLAGSFAAFMGSLGPLSEA